ncbi:uncharacterized protein NPIL_375491, partial [Nephila pilipes]
MKLFIEHSVGIFCIENLHGRLLSIRNSTISFRDYGYLKDANCPEAWEKFLVESCDLQEHYRLLQDGRTCSTNIEGKSLLDILHEYCSLKVSAQKNSENEPHPSNLNTSNFNSGASSSYSNSEAFNRFRANQKFQTQAITTSVRSGQESQSPKCSRNNSSPNCSFVPRTPRRLQEVRVTTLNFNTESEKNETSQFTYRGSFESPRRPVSARQSIRETILNQRSCISDPVKRNPHMLSRTVQTEANVDASLSSVDNTSDQTSSNSPSCQKLVNNISNDNSQKTTTLENSNSQATDQTQRIVELFEEQNLNTKNMLDSNKSINVERQSTVVNQSIVFTSTEIRAGEDSNSITPQYETEPPLYNRAPNTNSPRIILSYDRSQITSLTTPIKDKRQWNEDFSSPRRKGTIPRRRLLSESPHSKQLISNEYSLGVIREDLVETLIDDILANQPLAQRLADNINKVIGNDELLKDPDGSNSCSYPTLQDINSSGDIIKNILAKTETDPVFNDWFPFFFNSRDCEELNTVQESAAETSEPTFSGAESAKATKDASNLTAFASNVEVNSSKQTTETPKQICEIETKQNSNTESTSQTHLTENVQNVPCLDQSIPHVIESATNQNVTPASNSKILESVEDNVVNHSTEVSTMNTGPKDVLDSCMSLIRPDGDGQLQDYIFDSNNGFPDSANIIHSSLPTSISVIEDKTMPVDTSALKPVSIGTPFQVETQMAVTQSALSQTTTQTLSCNPSTSQISTSMPFIQNTVDTSLPITPVVQNTHICPSFNSSMPTTTLLQLPYSPMSTIVLPSSNAFPVQNSVQYRIVVPCGNWNCKNVTNDVVPIQTEINANIVHAADVNSSPIKIPADYSPTKALIFKDNVTQSDDVGNFITVASENVPSKKRNKKQFVKSAIQVSAISNPSNYRKGKKKRQKQSKKKRLHFLPPKNPTDASDSEIVDDIPVISIPDSSPTKNDSMSAMELLSSIVENKNSQSPLLKAMISSARILAEKGGRLNSTHVRALEFSSCVENEVNKETSTSKQLKTISKNDGIRSSPRLKQKKYCKSPLCSPSKSPNNVDSRKKENECTAKEKPNVTIDLVENTIEQLNTCKSVPSSMSDAVLSAMQEALQPKPVSFKKQNSSGVSDVLKTAEENIDLPEFLIKKTPSKSPITKGIISKEQYFPDFSGSDSDSDNLPISVIAESISSSNSKEKEVKLNSPIKNQKKSKPEAEFVKKHITSKSADNCVSLESSVEKSIAEEIISTKLSNKNTPQRNKFSPSLKDSVNQKHISEGIANHSSVLLATSVSKKCIREKQDISSNFSAKIIKNKELVKFNGDEHLARKIKSNSICNQQNSSQSNKSVKDSKEKSRLESLSDIPGNSSFHPIILDSDDDTERDKNTVVQAASEDQNRSQKMEKTRPRKKISKSKKVSRKKKVSSLFKKKKLNSKNSSKQKSNTSKEIVNSLNLSEKLIEKNAVNEPSDNHQLHKEGDLPISTTSPLALEGSLTGEKEKSKESKHSSSMLSPVKESNIKSQKSFEKVKGRSRISKKTKSIDELCDKLLRNASRCSPSKQNSSQSLDDYQLVQLPKLSADNVVNIMNEKSLEEQTIEGIGNTIITSKNKSLSEPELSLQEINTKNSAVDKLLKAGLVENLNEKESNNNLEVKTKAVDSGVKIISKEFCGEKRVIPPPKKRIRPVPVTSPCDQSFSPFSPFSSPAHSTCLDFNLKSKEMSSLSIDPSNSDERNAEILPDPEVMKSPIQMEVKKKCLSGKPKSMAEFYKSALPNRNSDLPISPDPISSSSCTIDTFLARRENTQGILSESSPNKETSCINKTSPGKEVKKIIHTKTLSLSENQSSGEEGLIKSPPKVSNTDENSTQAILSESSPNKETISVCKTSSGKEAKKKTQKRKLSASEDQSSDEEGLIKSPPKVSNTAQNSTQAIWDESSPNKETISVCKTSSGKEAKKKIRKTKPSVCENHSSDGEAVIKYPPKVSNTTKNSTQGILNESSPNKQTISVCKTSIGKESKKRARKRKLSLNENQSSDEEGLIKSPPQISNTPENSSKGIFNKLSPNKETCSIKKIKLSVHENQSSDEEGLIKSPPKISSTINNSTLPNPSSVQNQINAHVSSDEEGLIVSPVKNPITERNVVSTSSSISISENRRSYTKETIPMQRKSRNSDCSLKNVDNVKEKPTQAQFSSFCRPQPLYKIRQRSVLKKSNNPYIPAGVKFPSKWSNSTINDYSTTIGASTSKIDDRKDSEIVRSRGPRRSRPNIKVAAFKSPAKRSFRDKKSYSVERSFTRYQDRPNPPFKTLFSARAARRYNLEPRLSPQRHLRHNLNRSTIDYRRVENIHNQTNPSHFIYKGNEKSFMRDSKVYEGRGYKPDNKSSKNNADEVSDRPSHFNCRSVEKFNEGQNKSQISSHSESTFNKKFHCIQNVHENCSKNIQQVDEIEGEIQECEKQVTEINIDLFNENNKNTLAYDKTVKDGSVLDPDSFVLTLSDKCPSLISETETENKSSDNNSGKLSKRESLNDRIQEPDTNMLTIPDKFPSDNKTSESRKGEVVNNDRVSYLNNSFVFTDPDKHPASFRRTEEKNRLGKQRISCNKSDINSTQTSKEKEFVNDGVQNSDSYVLITMHDKVPLSSFKKTGFKNKLENQISPYSICKDNRIDKSRKGKSANDDEIQESDTNLLTKLDELPSSSFRGTEVENSFDKQRAPCNESIDNKTGDSRNEGVVNNDEVYDLDSFVFTVPDNLPSSLRITEKKNKPA